jgi:hypothetical protein
MGSKKIRNLFPLIDVCCRYREVKFAFEIGESKDNRKDYKVLKLSYSELESLSYKDLKFEIKNFLKMHSKVN